MEALLRAGCRQSYSRAVDRSSTIIGTALQQQRWASGGTGKEKQWKLKQRPFSSVEKAVKDKKPVDVVYEGAMADTLRRVKVLSLTTCCLSVAGGPLVTFFTSPDLSVIAKGAVASMMVMLSASTTAALHWFASPYVRKLTWTPGSNEMEVEVLSWIATPLRRTIKLSDVKTPMTQRPVVTFAANGNFYYIDKDNFPNAELLKKLAKSKQLEIALLSVSIVKSSDEEQHYELIQAQHLASFSTDSNLIPRRACIPKKITKELPFKGRQ